MQLRNTRPIVSFAFDDFPRTALSEGGRILEDAGVRGTFYAAFGLAGSCNSLGEQFQMEDLHRVVERGHELATHTFDHISARDVSNTRFLDNVRKGVEAIEPATGLKPSANFAYPFGCTNLRLKLKVGSLMTSCRGNFPGLNGAITDRNLLKANALYGGREALNAALELVSQNERLNGWLIFYTHDVRPEPSNFGCTPTLLEDLTKAVTSRGLAILPVQQVIETQGLVS
jgi:peptidoglycan/xylan/chitin deacetylase (PgdA/CDA1 family)